MTARNVEWAKFLDLSGVRVLEVKGISWYEYSGFLTPAYLPHCVPPISIEGARDACKAARVPFVRWTTKFGELGQSEWWHVIREGEYKPQDCSKKTRSEINRGKKELTARLLSLDEVLDQGYEVCKKAVERFDDNAFLPSKDAFLRRVHASMKVPGVMEYYGAFYGQQLVALAENVIQCNAVFWEAIWYDPKFLNLRSSYVLIDHMLDHYLNERKFLYVTDGNRSIYHATSVQDFFIKKFGFIKKYAELDICYSPFMRVAIGVAYTFRGPLSIVARGLSARRRKQLEGIVIQEGIRRSNAG